MAAEGRHHRVGIRDRRIGDDVAPRLGAERAHARSLEPRPEIVPALRTRPGRQLVARDAMPLVGTGEELERGTLLRGTGNRDPGNEENENRAESTHQPLSIFSAFSAARW